MAWKKSIIKAIPVILLLTIFLFLTLSSSIGNFPLYHEGERVFIGYSYIMYGNSINHAVYPILIHSLAALPIVFLDIDYPDPFLEESPKVFGQRDFLYYGDNDAEQIIFWSHIPFMIIAILFGLLIFIWTKELYNYKAGLFSLTLFTFSPTILAYTPTVGSDMILAFFFFLTSYLFWKLYQKPRPITLFLCGISFGLTILSKPPGIFILLVIFIIGIIGILKKQPLRIHKRNPFLTLIAIIFIILWIGGATFITFHLNEIHPIYNSEDPLYYNSGARSEDRLYEIVEGLEISEWQKESLTYIVTKVPVPAPHFIEGIYSTSNYLSAGSDTYWFSAHNTDGIKGHYHIIIFLLKNPISFLLLILLASIFIRKHYPKGKMSNYFLIIPIIIFPLQFIFSESYGGLVYLLPIFPFLFIITGNIINYKQWKRWWFKGTVITLLAIYIFVSLTTFPYYLSYFNSITGGTEEGYQVSLIDFDNYQDLYRLRDYIEENNIEQIKINYSYYSTTLPYQDFDYDYLEPNTPTTGLIAINANALMGLKEQDTDDFAWLKELEPIDRVGTTIFIYNVTENYETTLS